MDRIIGKASAPLICYFKAKKALAKVTSARAARVFSEHKIQYFVEESFKEIRNRTGTSLCPFERTVLEVENLAEAFKLIKQKVDLSTC